MLDLLPADRRLRSELGAGGYSTSSFSLCLSTSLSGSRAGRDPRPALSPACREVVERPKRTGPTKESEKCLRICFPFIIRFTHIRTLKSTCEQTARFCFLRG